MTTTLKTLTRVREIKEELEPLLQARLLAEKELEELGARLQRLNVLFEPELKIQSPAAANPYPGSTRKKITIVSLVASLVCLFGLMIGFDMTTPSWRAESMAERVGLPILARTPLDRKGRPSADEIRGLSLRLRQYVSGDGAVLLLTSLNEGHGIADLVADLAGFLAIRDEKVLVLDARIANLNADDLHRALARRPTAQPVQVEPTESDSISPRGPTRGLVQYLVFEGINRASVVVPTRAAGVDFVPAGGPYTITDALASEAMQDLIDGFRQQYTLILVIGPAASRKIDNELLASYAAGVVFVVNEPLSTPAPAPLFRALKDVNVPLLGSVLFF
jgi:Mrp family chromosome partitioning ATPase